MVPLPLDVVRIIFAHTGGRISTDKQTLLSCSHVCRGWTNLAQSFLYRKVSLDSDQRYDLFRDFLAATPRIAAYVREFEIYGAYADTYPLPPFLLLEILELLPHIEFVSLDNITVLGWPAYNPYPDEPFKLHRLRLVGLTNGPYFNRHCMRFDFLRLFELDWLTCVGNENSDEVVGRAVVSRRGVPSPVVRRLDVSGRDCFLDFNEKSGGGLDADELRTVYVEAGEMAEVKYGGRVLKRYAQSIRHVLLDLCMYARQKPKKKNVWDALNIQACSHLETLTLHLRESDINEWRFPRAEQPEQFGKAYSAVLASTSVTLKELTLELWDTKELAMIERAAPHVGSLIMQALARFTNLEKLVLATKWPETMEECKAALRKHVPDGIIDGPMVQFEYHSVFQ